MIKRISLALAILFCFLAVIPAGHPVFAKDTWISVRSKNFSLVGNASEKDIRQVAVRLEQFRDVFARLFPDMSFTSPVPTTVIVFKSDSSYKPFKPVADGKMVAVAGYFQPGRDVNYITLTSENRGEDSFTTIFHEYVHLLVNNTLGKTSVPPWFNEGIAEYYSTFDIQDDRKVFLGRLIPHHLDLLGSTQLLPLDRLFGVDYYSLERNKHDARGLFYAQSWALIHYLIQANEGKRLPQLGEFVSLLRQNVPLETAFRQAFQTDYAGMQKELKDYVQRRSFRGQIATFDKKLEFDSQITTSPLSEAEAQAYLGDLLYHIRRPEDARTRLEQALALDPKLPMAHASLGMVLMEQKKIPEARAQLEQAVAGNSSNYLLHYQYAFALSREVITEGQPVHSFPAETAAKMRTQLRRAIELNPDFPESYHLLAFLNLVTGEQVDESIGFIKHAVALSPGSEEFLFVLAQLYMRKEDWDAARKVVEPLAATGADPQIRANARNLLGSLRSIQSQIARFRERGDDDRSSDSAAPPRLRDSAEPEPEGPVENVDSGSYLREALRKPTADETQAEGTLMRIDCDSKGIVFVVKVGEQILRLKTAGFHQVDITSYSPDIAGQITCGPRKAEKVVICYVDKNDPRAKTNGTIRSIEFVPKDFVLKP